MKKLLTLFAATALAAGCYHDEHTATYVGAVEIHARHGHVVQVREIARTGPTSPPPAGALLGGIVVHEGGAAMIGDAFTGAGGPGRRAFQVIVSFDDGETGIFVYQDWSPYRPGDRVTLTPDGLILR